MKSSIISLGISQNILENAKATDITKYVSTIALN